METLWIIWISVALGMFAILEGVAITNRESGDTLTEVLRKWLGVNPPKASRRVAVGTFASLLVSLVVWLVLHVVGADQ
jgi:hypothetical protein